MRRAARSLPFALLAVALLAGTAHAASRTGSAVLQPRVIGGAPAGTSAYPYAARIQVDGLGTCTGTLVATRWVLTAGHCATEIMSGTAITDPDRFHVRIGNAKPAADQTGYQAVDLVLRHPSFDADRLRNDVTLLRLATPSGAPTVDLLPPAKAALARPGIRATIAGWGLISQDPTEVLAPTLYTGRIEVMSDAACKKEWGGDVDLASMLCAGPVGGNGAETCSGDSGGPLLVTDAADHRRVYQAGSTSFGAEDCSASSSVFARLSGTSIRSFVVNATGLGPAGIGTPVVTSAGTTSAVVTATVVPRGADVWVVAEYGDGYRQATAPVRVPGGAGRAVSVTIRGLTPGRTRNVRIVARSGYGTRHSHAVRVATTDAKAPSVRPRPARGAAGQRIRLRFQPTDDSRQVAVLVDVLAGDRLLGRLGSLRKLRNVTNGGTYFLAYRMPGSGTRPTRFCVRVQDRAGHRSATRCASITRTVGQAATPSATAFTTR